MTTYWDDEKQFRKGKRAKERAIINNLLYDTEKAEFLLGYCEGKTKAVKVLYKTKRGRYFAHNIQKESITPMTEESARDLIKDLSIEKYIELFGT